MKVSMNEQETIPQPVPLSKITAFYAEFPWLKGELTPSLVKANAFIKDIKVQRADAALLQKKCDLSIKRTVLNANGVTLAIQRHRCHIIPTETPVTLRSIFRKFTFQTQPVPTPAISWQLGNDETLEQTLRDPDNKNDLRQAFWILEITAPRVTYNAVEVTIYKTPRESSIWGLITELDNLEKQRLQEQLQGI